MIVACCLRRQYRPRGRRRLNHAKSRYSWCSRAGWLLCRALFVPVLLAFVSLVAGETCPAPVDVETRVRAILHLSPEQALTEGFVVERHEAGLYVALRSSDSTLIGERTLPTAGSCDELAQAAAVVLAAWLTHVHPDFAGELPPPSPEPATIEPEQPEPPAPAPAVTPPPPVTPRPAARAAAHRLHVGVGVGGDLVQGAASPLSPAAWLGAAYGAEVTGFAVSVRALFTLSRDEPLGPGQVRWRRWPLGIGPTLRLATTNTAFAFSAGPAVAWLHLGGDSFDRSTAQDGLLWGGFAEAQVSGPSRPLTPFGAVSVQLYPGNTTAYVSGLDLQWELPALSASLIVGARLSP
jgi:hypothetical protein